VTTGKKFQYAGHGPGERVDRLRKEIELIDLEVHSHREMVAKLRYVQEFVMLTGEQAREVASEVGWRKEELRRLANIRHNKATSITQWGSRLEEARARSTT
jgi:acetyl-CoA acetyltransferase